MIMFFQSELGWNVFELMGQSIIFGCWTHLQKQETKIIDGDLLVASPMPKLVHSGGGEYQLLRNEVLCIPFINGVTWYL